MVEIRTHNDVFKESMKYFLAPDQTKGSLTTKKALIDYFSEVDKLLLENKDSIKNDILFKKLFGFPRNQFMAVKWVVATSHLTGLNKLVAISIASFYNTKLGYAYPTQNQIASVAGISLRSVAKAIQEMKKSGEWLVVSMQDAPYEKVLANRYYLLPPAGYGTVMDTFINSKTIDDSIKISDLKDSTKTSSAIPLTKQINDSFFEAFAVTGKTIKQDTKNKYPKIGKALIIQPGQTKPLEIVAQKYIKLPRYMSFEKSNGDFDRKTYWAFMKRISS